VILALLFIMQGVMKLAPGSPWSQMFAGWGYPEGSQIHTSRESPLMRRSMIEIEIEKRLDPARFARVHRSSIVNMEPVRRLDPLPHGEYRITLDDDTELISKRGFREILRRHFPDLV